MNVVRPTSKPRAVNLAASARRKRAREVRKLGKEMMALYDVILASSSVDEIEAAKSRIEDIGKLVYKRCA